MPGKHKEANTISVEINWRIRIFSINSLFTGSELPSLPYCSVFAPSGQVILEKYKAEHVITITLQWLPLSLSKSHSPCNGLSGLQGWFFSISPTQNWSHTFSSVHTLLCSSFNMPNILSSKGLCPWVPVHLECCSSAFCHCSNPLKYTVWEHPPPTPYSLP